MASKSAKYLVKNKNNENASQNEVFGITALIHSTGGDLSVLLNAADSGIERIPLFYFVEGKA